MEFAGLVTQVYVDVMLAVNFIMDFFILWAAGRMAHIKVGVWRLMLGALLGASYSLVIFFPESSLLNSLLAKIVCSVLMVLLAFYPLKFRALLSSLVYLYLISFAMGGAVIAATYLANDAPGYVQVFSGGGIYASGLHYGWLLIGLLVALVIGWGGIWYLRRNKLQQELVSTVIISLLGQTVKIKALLDTGNQLREPLTNRLVVVVEAEFLQSQLPSSIWQAIKQEDLVIAELAAGLEPEWASRIRLIPFSSVGRSNGMMAGIRPDWVEVINKEGTYRRSDLVLGLINKTLCKEGKYQALLPSAMFEEN